MTAGIKFRLHHVLHKTSCIILSSFFLAPSPWGLMGRAGDSLIGPLTHCLSVSLPALPCSLRLSPGHLPPGWTVLHLSWLWTSITWASLLEEFLWSEEDTLPAGRIAMGGEVGMTRPLPQGSPEVHEEWELETKYPACQGLESAVPSCALTSSQRALVGGVVSWLPPQGPAC